RTTDEPGLDRALGRGHLDRGQRSGRRRGKVAGGRVGVDSDDRRADLDHRPLGVMDLEHLAGPLRRDLDGGLGRLDLADRLVELDLVTDRDEPLEDLALGQPFPEVGKVERLDPGHRGHHPNERSTASSTRSRSGRYSSSTLAAGYGVLKPVT